MAFLLINSAHAVFVSTGRGLQALQRLSLKPAKVAHLPVFSNIESDGANASEAAQLRLAYAAPGEPLIGHFGRYMANTMPLVIPVLEALLRSSPKAKVLFIGECGPDYQAALSAIDPNFTHRIFASGVGSSREISRLLSACDLMFQPYPGGITTRRGSTMAALANGRPLVSNRAEETENLWDGCGGVRLLTAADPETIAFELHRLAAAPAKLKEMSAAASTFYGQFFSLEHTVNTVLTEIEAQRKL